MKEREYRRIKVPELRAHYNILPCGNSPALMVTADKTSYPPFREDNVEGVALQNAIISRIEQLEAKIDRLIGYLEREKNGICYHFRGDVLDIGGGGLSLRVEEAQSIETYLDLCIFSRIGDTRPIFAIGRVCWVNHYTEANEPPFFVLGVEFSDIGEDDQRAIVRMVFQTERKQRRDRCRSEEL